LVREFATPLTVDVPASATLLDAVEDNARDHPDWVAFSRRDVHGRKDVTAAEFRAEVRAVAKGLIGSGVEAGDRVALLAKTRYEWTLVDYAIWYAGAVTVPVYETSSPEQVAWIVADAQCAVVVVEHEEHVSRLPGTDAGPSSGRTELTVWTMEPTTHHRELSRLVDAGKEVDDEVLDARRASLTADDVATIIYTSGTTGNPKGCVLSHRNFLAEIEGTTAELHRLFEPTDAATLLFLPLPHVFARIIQVGAVRKRVRLGHTSDVRHLVEDLESFAPTFVLAVPRMFEKIVNTASQRATVDGHGRLFDRATDVAIAYSQALDDGRPSALLRTRHRVLDRLVYQRVRASLGGRCRWAISGGAPLGERLSHYFRGIGIPVLEGYGLTETTGATTVNSPDAMRVGSVGRPVPGARVRVDDEGELLVAGDHVFSGYWNNPAATAEAVTEEGWLRTGDLGEIDDQGFVRVTPAAARRSW
jgi:long-chain acyl-CoA synthetase